MPWYHFAGRLIVAFVLGGLVGAERQWRQRTAGLRTNCLVALGSAMFVMMGGLIGGADGSQGRVAAYIVSGIGFIGGGVILKEGFSIRGLNTAATLWCTAAVGTLAGLGDTTLCVLGTAAVLAANLVLRPLAERMNRAEHRHAPEEVLYRLEAICRSADEVQVRTLLLQNINRTPLALYGLESEDQQGHRVLVRAYLRATGRQEETLEQIVTRLSLEPGVTTIRWEIAAAGSRVDPTLAAGWEAPQE
jgi:putative Mg2+ transporter-C (MgtC) family protein